jgi:hypothetical protein
VGHVVAAIAERTGGTMVGISLFQGELRSGGVVQVGSAICRVVCTVA